VENENFAVVNENTSQHDLMLF